MNKFEGSPKSNNAWSNHNSVGKHEVTQVKPNEASLTAMCGVAQAWHRKQVSGEAHRASRTDESDGTNSYDV